MLDKIRKLVCPLVCTLSSMAETFIEFYDRLGWKGKLILLPCYLLAMLICAIGFFLCGCGM